MFKVFRKIEGKKKTKHGGKFPIHSVLEYPELNMSHSMTKPTEWLHPAKTQISLGICPVWSETSLSAQWVAKDPSFLHADSEDSDQTGRMPRLI